MYIKFNEFPFKHNKKIYQVQALDREVNKTYITSTIFDRSFIMILKIDYLQCQKF